MNLAIFHALNDLAGKTNFLDSLIVFLARDLPFILIAFFIVKVFFIKKHLKWFFAIVLTSGFAAFISEFLKWTIFRHPRPFAILPEVVSLINITPFDSFPSTHAAIFMALAVGIFLYKRSMGVWFLIGALVIGVARVAAGVHFPVDILVGFVIGALSPLLGYYLTKILSGSVNRRGS